MSSRMVVRSESARPRAMEDPLSSFDPREGHFVQLRFSPEMTVFFDCLVKRVLGVRGTRPGSRFVWSNIPIFNGSWGLYVQAGVLRGLIARDGALMECFWNFGTA